MTRGRTLTMKRGMWMENVNRGKNMKGDGVRERTRERMDFKNTMQLRFTELRMQSQYTQETAPFAGTHD